MGEKTRDYRIDILKGLGIICMVLGHSGCAATHFIYLFHMAIFFIASGYCYKDSNSADVKGAFHFFIRKVKTLWFPYVLWTAIYSLLHNFFISINVYTDNPLLLEYVSGKFVAVTMPWSVSDMLKNIFKAMLLHGGTQLGGAFWFMAALMEISVCYCAIDLLLNFVFKKKNNMVFLSQCIISVIFLIVGFCCFKFGKNIAGLDLVFSFYILFHGGRTLRKYGRLAQMQNNWIHAVALAIAFIGLLVLNRFGSVSLGNNSYEDPVFLLIVSFLGWQFIYEIAFFIEKLNALKALFVCVGQNTLSIVILHFLCFKIVSFIGVIANGQPLCLIAAFPILYQDGAWWIAYTFVGVSIPVCLGLLYKKVKLLIVPRLQKQQNKHKTE